MPHPLSPIERKILAREHELEYVYDTIEKHALRISTEERNELYERSREIVHEIGDLKRELVGLPPLPR